MTDEVEEINNTPTIENNTKSIGTKFEKMCNHCNKILKSATTYERHINNQLCYSKNDITFCKICKITMDSREKYIKHLLSMEHLNSIGCNKLETLNTNQPRTILQADPYLSNNEARSIGTNNLGNKFTFVFQNNQTQIVDLMPHKTTLVSTTCNETTAETTVEHKEDSKYKTFERVLEPSEKQKKILVILERVGTEEEGRTILCKLLDKLHIEDYRGLQTFIRANNNISNELKNVYLDIMDKFITMLVKCRNNGETVYKDKDISKLVISLTL